MDKNSLSHTTWNCKYHKQTLENPFLGKRLPFFPSSPVPEKPPQAASPCSWACRRLFAPPPQSEPKRSTPAPCSWGGCASTPSQRHWPAALPPHLPTQKLAKMASMTASEASRPVTLSRRAQALRMSGATTSGLNPSLSARAQSRNSSAASRAKCNCRSTVKHSSSPAETSKRSRKAIKLLHALARGRAQRYHRHRTPASGKDAASPGLARRPLAARRESIRPGIGITLNDICHAFTRAGRGNSRTGHTLTGCSSFHSINASPHANRARRNNTAAKPRTGSTLNDICHAFTRAGRGNSLAGSFLTSHSIFHNINTAPAQTTP